jgi:hypothetical protein
MTSLDTFVADLGSRGVKIWLEGDRIRINAPIGLIDDQLKAEIKLRKSELIEYLSKAIRQDRSCDAPPENHALYEHVRRRLEETGLSKNIFDNFDTHLSVASERRVHPRSLLQKYNDNGNNTPVFLCLGYQEVTMIADRLGPNQPVYGMRPGNKMMENTNENKQALARYLTREILDIQPKGPFMLGGFCQGAKIITYIARELRQLGHNISLIVTIDNLILQPCSEGLVLIFGEDSYYNPYRYFANPNAGLRQYFETIPDIYFYKGDHVMQDTPDAVMTVADVLKDLITSASSQRVSKEKTCDESETLLPEGYYKCSIDAPGIVQIGEDPWLVQKLARLIPTRLKPLFFRRVRAKVTITNHSMFDWKRSETGTIYFCCRWFQPSFHSVLNFEICARLPGVVKAGDSVEFSTRLKIPIVRDQYRIEFDLMDKNRNWFRDHGGSFASSFIHLD